MIDEPADQQSLEISFAAYVHAYAVRLLGFALTICGTRGEAEDCVAETFLKIWKVWPAKHEEIQSGGIAYAMTVLKRSAIDRHRSRERRVKECELEQHHLADLPARDDIEASHLYGELQRELWAAVGTLPEVQQQLLYLIYVEEYKVSAVARMLDLSRTTADRYHRLALRELKKLLGP